MERIAASRAEVTAAAADLRARFDLPARLRQSFRSHPAAWFGASLAAGLLAAGRLFRRRGPRAGWGTSADRGRISPGGRAGWTALLLAGAGSVAKSLARDWLWRESRKRFPGIRRF